MKITYSFLLAAGFALSQSLPADGQSLFPASQAAPSVVQYRFTPKQPLGSLWQPLSTPVYNLDASQQATGRIYLDRGTPGLTLKPRIIFPLELPTVNYNDLPRDSHGRLNVHRLPAATEGFEPS
jgi:hypothetical protein